ncbi:MAG: right-handed parallel beta-helix repeat-containing protein [Chitinophagaceae bacterium]
MKFIIPVLFSLIASGLYAQTIYVDAVKGRPEARGAIADPLPSLEQAVMLAGGFSGNEPVIVKVAPGLYTFKQLAEIRTGKKDKDTIPYIIEAMVLPDDPDWLPSKTPVIQSVSIDNSTNQFTHCAGFLVSKNNVSFRGLKFTGNANPAVRYYYPITRESENLAGLSISQCYFIGERNSSPIQGAVWAHGAGTHVDHCIFYECKNALLLFKSISDFSLTHSIIYGSYEAAVWFGPFTSPFVFRDNIITHCNYFWLGPDNTKPAYQFSSSLIVENDKYMGYYTSSGPVPAKTDSIKEINIRKTGKVLLSEVKTAGIPNDYLNQIAGSAGKDIPAGIFKKLKE